MSAAQRIIRNTTYLYAKMGITLLVNLYATRQILKYLGADDFGLFGVVAGVVNMLGFLNATVMHTTQRFVNYHMGRNDLTTLKRVFNSSMVIHALIALIVFFLMETAARPLFSYALTIDTGRLTTARTLYHLMVITSVCTILTCPYDACINAHEHLLFYALTGLAESLLRLVIACTLPHITTDRLLFFGSSITLVTFLLLLVKLLFCRRCYAECQCDMIRSFDRRLLREQLTYASWNFLGVTGIVLGNYGGGMVLNHFFGTRINAAHSLSNQMRGHLLAITNNLSKAINPVITKKAGEGDIHTMLRFSLTGCKLTFFLFSLAALPFLIETPFLLRIWLQDPPLRTVTFLRWDLLISWTELLTLPLHTTLFACGYVTRVNLFSGIAHVTPVLLALLLISGLPIPTILYALTFFFTDILTPMYILLLMRRYYHLDIPLFLRKTCLPAILLTTLVLTVGLLLCQMFEEGWIRLLLITTVTDLLFAWLMHRYVFDNPERSLIRKSLMSIIRKLSHTFLPCHNR